MSIELPYNITSGHYSMEPILSTTFRAFFSRFGLYGHPLIFLNSKRSLYLNRCFRTIWSSKKIELIIPNLESIDYFPSL